MKLTIEVDPRVLTVFDALREAWKVDHPDATSAEMATEVFTLAVLHLAVQSELDIGPLGEEHPFDLTDPE